MSGSMPVSSSPITAAVTSRVSRRSVLRLGALPAAVALGVMPISGAVRRAAAQDEPVTLNVWLGGEPGTVNSTTEIFDKYTADHPNVTIEPTFVGSDLFNPTLLPALNAGEGPDIWMGGTGPGQPAAIIEAGFALDLTPYYCSLGWNEVIPEGIVATTSSDGKLWAVGDSVETTKMFYNKEIFEQNGLAVPTSWDELMAACDTLKEAGFDTPIGLGGGDKWPISHWQSLLWGLYAGPEGVDNVLFGDGRWDDPVFVEATAKLKELNDQGCFGPNALAVMYDDLIAQFWRGEIPMTFTGPWIIGAAARDLGDDINKFSVFEVPSPVEGGTIYPTADIGQGWYINAASQHPDEAADLLNVLLFDPESRATLLQSGDSVPVGELDLSDVELPALLEEVFALSNEHRDNGLIHAFLDTVTPSTMTDVTYDGLQAVIAGQMTPEEFNAAVQAAWEEAKAEDLHLQPGGVECTS